MIQLNRGIIPVPSGFAIPLHLIVGTDNEESLELLQLISTRKERERIKTELFIMRGIIIFHQVNLSDKN
jgi:hypothetical protein